MKMEFKSNGTKIQMALNLLTRSFFKERSARSLLSVVVLSTLVMSGCSKAKLTRLDGKVATGPGVEQTGEPAPVIASTPPAPIVSLPPIGVAPIVIAQPAPIQVPVVEIPPVNPGPPIVEKEDHPPVGRVVVVVQRPPVVAPPVVIAPVAPAPTRPSDPVVRYDDPNKNGNPTTVYSQCSAQTNCTHAPTPNKVTAQPTPPKPVSPPITQPATQPVTQPVAPVVQNPIKPATQPVVTVPAKLPTLQPVPTLNPTTAPAPFVCNKRSEQFTQPQGKNLLDIIVVSETRIQANNALGSLGNAIADILMKGYEDKCNQLGLYSDVRVGILPALSKGAPLHGQIATLRYLPPSPTGKPDQYGQNPQNQKFIGSKLLKASQWATYVRQNLQLVTPQDVVTSGDGVPGGNAGLVSLETLLSQNVEQTKALGLLRDGASLHVIFVSSRGDLCAITGTGAVTGSQNQILKQSTCAGFNQEKLAQLIERLREKRTVVLSSIVNSQESTVAQMTHTTSGQKVVYSAGVGYGYKEFMERINGQVIELSQPNNFASQLQKVDYKLDGPNSIVFTGFNLKETPVAGKTTVWAAEPFDKTQSVLQSCREVTTATVTCPNVRKSVCNANVGTCAPTGKALGVRENGKMVNILGTPIAPTSVIHVEYCAAN